MQYEYSFYTDVGISKVVNEDSYIFKLSKIRGKLCLMACVCDGVGGLSMGEFASKEASVCLAEWFEYELPQLLDSDEEFGCILKKRWENLIQSIDQQIKEYGRKSNARLGTTLSCLLIIDERYYFCHVGDSRIYCFNDGIRQLTTDHTFLAQEVRQGRMTQEEADRDSRQNMILQCVGAGKNVKPEIQSGQIKKDDIFLICSDGFRHKLSEKEMESSFSVREMYSPNRMRQKLMEMTELVKCRGERDNITSMVIKAVEPNKGTINADEDITISADKMDNNVTVWGNEVQ